MAAELRDLVVGRRTLPAALLTVRFSRSGGPGGQNVNKVETKVDLRLDLEGCSEIFRTDELERIRARLDNRLDGEGRLQVVSSEHRSRARNLDAALLRMEALLTAAVARPRTRRPTRPTRASQRRRLDDKKRRGAVKRQRKDRGDD